MTLPLTFTGKKLVDTTIVGPDGGVHYTTSTTHGFLGRKLTTINAASGLVGLINWREKVFIINGVQQKWEDLKERSKGIFSGEREWHWDNRAYKLNWHHSGKELVATPGFSGAAGPVRFTEFKPHLFHDHEPAAIHFPQQMRDEIERMFLLMAILQMEMHKQDQKKSAEIAEAAAG
ncbi:hypothetical protein C8R46DRAFT_1046853 [Mycena filopes]|nr:hypothetical protein C8R46DRAFT_1046853 [Mycena filopes]